MTMHVRLRAGRSPHHIFEAAVQGHGEGARRRLQPHRSRRRAGDQGIPSTKGTLMTTIAVLDYGSGNLRSVSRATRARRAARALVTRDTGEIAGADALVDPRRRALRRVHARDLPPRLDAAIEDFVATGRPVFGVCVGHAGAVRGQRRGRRAGPRRPAGPASSGCPSDVRVPHMGWDTVSGTAPHPYVDGLPDARASTSSTRSPRRRTAHASASTSYGGTFAAAVAHGTTSSRRSSTPRSRATPGLQVYERFVRRRCA